MGGSEFKVGVSDGSQSKKRQMSGLITPMRREIQPADHG